MNAVIFRIKKYTQKVSFHACVYLKKNKTRQSETVQEYVLWKWIDV